MSSGGIVDSILADIANSDPSELPPSDATAPSLLPIEVIRYIRSYLSNYTPSSDKPDCCVFIQTEQLRSEAAKHDTSRHSSFNLNMKLDIQGKVFLSTSDLTTSHSINTVFNDIDNAVDWMSTHGLDVNPSIIVSLTKKIVHWYPEGTNNEELLKQYTINDIKSISVNEIDNALDHFHQNQVLTPSCTDIVWSNAGKYYPGKNLEKKIQELLKVVLASRFHESIVIDELPSPVGRYDLLIAEHVKGSAFIHSALLELKALKTFAFSESDNPTKYYKATHTKAVREGLDQTYEYKEKWKVNLGYLCCYDARQDASSDIMKVIEDDATDKDVNLRHYILYNSPQNYRRAQKGSSYSKAD